MPEISSYKDGQFCWADLTTSDPKAAKSFYTSLFGWSVKDAPSPEGVYSMLQIRGKDVAALAGMRDEEKKQGVPPHWSNYVSVSNADAAAKKAKSLGGNIVAGPFDVMDAGRMAIIADSQGAVFAVWQPGRSIGSQIIDEPNTMCWNELMTSDIEGARKFYSGLFGWKLKVSPEYTEIHLDAVDRGVGGMMQIRPDMKGMPPNWIPYFAVTDADGTAKKAQAAKGHIGVPPTDIPNVGRFSVLADPQGARFAIIQVKM
jgi:predicted enzyme related to lactoylglutathione lyase